MTKTTMKIQAVAHNYWRSVKRGNRTFESLADEQDLIQKRLGYPSTKEQVLYLAMTDVANGTLTEEEFEYYTGLIYADLVSTEE